MFTRFTLLSLLSALCITGHTQTLNTLSNEEKNDQWQLLFDGSSLKGWHSYNRQYPGSEWEIKDNAIHLADRARPVWGTVNDLVSDKTFTNFDLKLEWKIAANGNSGVMFWVQEDPNNNPSYFTGPEMQVLDDFGTNVSASKPKQKAGDLFSVIEGSEHNARPAGEWNQIEIRCQDGLVKFYQNGVNIITTRIGDDNWRSLVIAGNGDKRPMLGMIQTGKIVLQDAGDEVWYRNIRIKDLDKKTESTGTNETKTAVTPPAANTKPGAFANDTGALKIYMNTRLTGTSPKYNYSGDWTLSVDVYGKVSGMISWLVTLKEDPGIFTLEKNNFREKENISGTYDKVSKKLSLEGYGPDPANIFDRFEINLKDQDKLTGTDQVMANTGIRNGDLTGIYRLLNKRKSVYVNSNSDPRLVGRWIAASVSAPLLPKPLVGGTIEFFDNGAGLSKTSINPDYSGKVEFFDWSVNGNDLYLSGNDVKYTLVNGQLKIGNSLFKKVAVDPLQDYHTIIPKSTGTGNWIAAAFVTKGKMFYSSKNLLDPQNMFYDIHAFSDRTGEVITFYLPAFSNEIPFDSLTVYKYSPLTDADQSTSAKKRVAFDGLSKTFQTEYDCRFEDNVAILHNEIETIYLIKVNNPIWQNLSALHNNYNAYYFRKVLPPPGTHWEQCTHCFGTGKIAAGYNDVYDHTNQNGNPVYRKEAVQADCAECDGQGGYYVDDETGKRNDEY